MTDPRRGIPLSPLAGFLLFMSVIGLLVYSQLTASGPRAPFKTTGSHAEYKRDALAMVAAGGSFSHSTQGGGPADWKFIMHFQPDGWDQDLLDGYGRRLAELGWRRVPGQQAHYCKHDVLARIDVGQTDGRQRGYRLVSMQEDAESRAACRRRAAAQPK